MRPNERSAAGSAPEAGVTGTGVTGTGVTGTASANGPSVDEVARQFRAVGPGPTNGVTDVGGLEVGHYTRTDAPYLTGTTVVLARGGAVAAAAVGGGAPATRDTDALDPRNLVGTAHAVVLSGGSAYGLDATGGTMRWLEERRIGRPVGARPEELVPIVPAAALFDLGRGGSFSARPDVNFGYAAAEAASSGAVAEGNVGAGTGAVIGAFVGRALKGGTGTASVITAGGVTVAALVALNALGQAVDRATGLPLAGGLLFPGELPQLSPSCGADLEAHFGTPAPAWDRAGHTSLVVVATDALLSKSEAADLARVAHDGLVRALRPAHTRFDGDIVFALATGARPLVEAGMGADPALAPASWPAREDAASDRAPSVANAAHALDMALAHLGQLGADCVSRAVVHALLAATSTREFISYRDAFTSVFH
jgi:putative pantetheine hydrolase